LQFITFHNLLTAPMSPPNLDVSRYYSFTIFDALFYVLVIDVIYEGIKIVLLSIPDDKTPRLDGFTFFFFKKSWVIIGVDFIAVIQYFFDHCTLPQCINATKIA